ncbi:MAG: GIY-YIG nuclease family protein [Aquificaceae bacterium]
MIPKKPGVYMFIDEDGNVVYVGQTGNLKRRYQEHTRGNINASSFRKTLYKDEGLTKEEITQYTKSLRFKYEVIHDDNERMRREKELIQRHTPKYNKQQ